MEGKLEPVVPCTYCDMEFITRFNTKRDEKERHVRESTAGYMLIDHDHVRSDK